MASSNDSFSGGAPGSRELPLRPKEECEEGSPVGQEVCREEMEDEDGRAVGQMLQGYAREGERVEGQSPVSQVLQRGVCQKKKVKGESAVSFELQGEIGQDSVLRAESRAGLAQYGGWRTSSDASGSQPRRRDTVVKQLSGLDGAQDSDEEEEDEVQVECSDPPEPDDATSQDDDEVVQQTPQGPKRVESPFLKFRGGPRWRLARALVKPVMAHRAMKDWKANDVFKDVMQILSAPRQDLLDEMLEGNVQKASRRVQALGRTALGYYCDDMARLVRVEGPSHYLWEHVNVTTGETPLPKHMFEVADIAERYLKSRKQGVDEKDLVRKIDSFAGGTFDYDAYRKGERRYMSSSGSEERLGKFLDRLRTYLRGEPQDKPLAQPLREVGYSNEVNTRLQSHGGHRSSNEIMNLFDAISQGVLRTQFGMSASVIHVCVESQHAVVGEIVWSLVAQSYTNTGRGFNYHQAGLSNASAWAGQDVEVMNGLARWTIDKTDFVKTWEKECELMEQDRQERQQLSRKIADLETSRASQRLSHGGGPVSWSDVARVFLKVVEEGGYVGDDAKREDHKKRINEALQLENLKWEGATTVAEAVDMFARAGEQ